MPAKKYERPATIGLSTSEEIKDKLDSLCNVYGLNRGEMFELILKEWLDFKCLS